MGSPRPDITMQHLLQHVAGVRHHPHTGACMYSRGAVGTARNARACTAAAAAAAAQRQHAQWCHRGKEDGPAQGPQHAFTWCGGMLRFSMRSSSVSFTNSVKHEWGMRDFYPFSCYGTGRRRQRRRNPCTRVWRTGGRSAAWKHPANAPMCCSWPQQLLQARAGLPKKTCAEL